MHMTGFGWAVFTLGLVLVVGLGVGAALFFTKPQAVIAPVIVEEQVEFVPVTGTATTTATTTP
tara:strand:+ start:388975 stop:389163 length:189 start_codon:yes stop_codon:yes gene_type:complete